MKTVIAPMTLLDDGTVARLRTLVETYAHSIDLPPAGRWSGMTDSQIWMSFVVQVCVVGSAASGERLVQGMAAQENWYGLLVGMTPEQRRASIHEALRAYGVRYSMDDARSCRKTSALVKNLVTLIRHGGPRAYVERLAHWPNERTRVDVVIRDMAFIKNKGARDLLIGLGLLMDALAFDTRVLNVLSAMGAQFPKNVASDADTYARLELELIERVCRPAGVSGAVLDRIMFQKYAQIVPRKRADADCS